MNIRYAEEKCFTQEQVQALFRSVGWVSGEYPSRLHKALMHSSTVITAWDGDQLVGLVRLLDDREYIEIMPEESKNAAFYQQFGFKIMEDGVPMQLCNFADKKGLYTLLPENYRFPAILAMVSAAFS